MAGSTVAMAVLLALAPTTESTVLSNGLVLVFAMGAALVLARSARLDSKHRIWALLAAGVSFFAAGEGYWFLIEGILGRAVPPLSIADAFYLVGYVFLILALASSLPRGVRSTTRTRLVLDATVVFSAIMAIAWIVFGRNLAYAEVPVREILVASAYPTLDLALASFLLFLLRGVRRVHRPRILMLGLGLLLWSAVDAVYASEAVREGFASGLPVDALWIGGYISFALAALVRLDLRPDQRAGSLDPQWANAIYLPLLLLVPLAAYDTWRTGILDLALAGIVLVLIAALGGRQAMNTREILEAHEDARRHAKALEEAQAIAHVGSWEFDLRSHVLQISKEARHIFGIARDGLVSYDAIMQLVHPDDFGRVEKTFWGSVQERRPFEMEHRVIVDGKTKFLAHIGATLYDADGPVRSIGTVQDITVRKALEAALKERLKELRVISATATKSTGTNDVTDMLQTTVEKLEPAFLHDGAWVAVYLGPHRAASAGDPEGGALVHEFHTVMGPGRIEVRYRTPHPPADTGPFLREEQGLLHAVADILESFAQRIHAAESLAGREAALQETQSLARLGSWTWRPSTKAIWWSREMYNIFERPPGLGPLDLEEVMDFLDPDSGQAAMAAVEEIAAHGGTFETDVDLELPGGSRKSLVARAHVPRSKAGPDAVVTGTMQDITSRVQAQRELRFQADLLATVRQAVFATDLEGSITFWNPAAAQLFGWSQAEAVGRPVGSVLGEQQTIEAVEGAASECWGRRKDGSKVLIQLSTTPLLDDGELVGFIGIAQDVTKARALQKRFQDVVHNSPAGIFQTNWKGQLLLANPAYAHMAGYPSVAALMAGVTDVTSLYVDRADRDWIKAEVLDHGLIHGVEFRIKRPDGAVRWVRADVNLEESDGQKVLNGFVQDITEERQAKKRYQDLVENSPDGMFRTTVAGELQYSNDAAAVMLGYGSGEKLLAEVPRVTDLYVDPNDRKRFIDALQEPDPGPFETRFRRRDGSHVWIEIRARMHGEPGEEPAIEGTFRDLTARRERDELLRRLAAVVEFSEEAIYTKDIHGIVTTWNAAAVAMFGYGAHEAIGRPIVDLIVPEDRVPQYHRFMERLLAGRSVPRHDNVRRRKDGSRVDVSLTLVPIRDLEGRVVSISVSSHDITDRLQAETAEKARIENEHLKQLDQTLRDFINAAAHDLNQPLTPMKIALTTLEETPDPSPALVAKSLKTVKRSVDRMELLVADLLDVARLESGTLRFEFETLELQATLVEVKDFFAAAAAERGLDWQVESPTPLRLTVDPRRLMQVLFNLVGNAFKFVPEGGLVRLRARRRDEAVRFEVEDNGLGLTDEQMVRLFRPFTQVHEHLEDTPKGTGLGLYISKGIVEKHGGTIGVSSGGPGKGSTFWFEVPLTQSRDPAQPAPE